MDVSRLNSTVPGQRLLLSVFIYPLSEGLGFKARMSAPK